ncbi:MAG TPA: ComEC/Rec2 family competence protein [Candidatus Sulfotelmatobacter sp.]
MNSSTSLGPPSFDIKATRQPLLWGAIAHAAGIVAGVYCWRPELWWVMAGCAFAAAAAFFVERRKWLAVPLSLGALFLAGALHIQARNGSKHADASIQGFADGQDLEITAHVTNNGRLRAGNFGEMAQVVDVETEAVTTQSGASTRIAAGVRMSIYSPASGEDSPRTDAITNRTARPFRYGERIRFLGKLRMPHNFRNPGAFDYQVYLADNGIEALGSAKAENAELLPGFLGSRTEAWRSRIRENILAQVQKLWPAREAALIDAMVIGEGAFLDRDERVDFQRSGTYHVLIVSGMNVSILAFVIYWTLRKLHVGQWVNTLLTVGCCFGYALLTEVGVPVWRATLMCTIYLVTRLIYRERAMVNAIGAAALAVLVFDPRQLLTASFQMTFLCVLLVAAIGLPILERTSQLYKRALAHWDSANYGRSLPPEVMQFRVDLRMIADRIGRFCGKKWAGRMVRFVVSITLASFELLFISAVMQMGLALPMAYYFHRATTIGLPANIAVVPLTELMMPAAIGALVLTTVWLKLAKIPAFFATLALRGIVGTVHGLGGLRMADLRVATPSMLMMLLAATALLVAMALARRRLAIAMCGLAALLVSSLAIALIPPKPRVYSGMIEMTSIDVGEGDSTLLVMPQGTTLLVDAGGPIGPGTPQFDFGEDVVSPYLWQRGISQLDAVAITHGHSDHIGGMASVLKNFRPRELWLGIRPPSAGLDRLIAEAAALHIKVVRHWEGDEFDWGGATVSVLFPPRDWPVGSKPQNSDSLVLRVSHGASSVLLEGDAEKQVERRIASLHHPKANILRVGHHGSANATTEELLSAARPDFAVISVGLHNSFGLPKFGILERLSLAGVKVYRTDLDGAVTFYLNGSSLTPSLAADR